MLDADILRGSLFSALSFPLWDTKIMRVRYQTYSYKNIDKLYIYTIY